MADYIVRSDIENIFGEANVQKWADINNDKQPSKIQSRINYFCKFSTVYVNGRLIQGRYAVPFDEDSVPTIIVHLTSLIAGVGLYDGRLIIPAEPRRDEASGQRKQSRKLLYEILSGQLRLIDPISGEYVEQQGNIAPTVWDATEFETAEDLKTWDFTKYLD